MEVSGNACSYAVQNILSSTWLSKNLKIKIYRTIILPCVLCGCETWLLMYVGVSGNACCYSLQNILSSTWLSKNLKI